MKPFDIHLSTGEIRTINLVDSRCTQEYFLVGLKPSGWICTEDLENFNMAHIVAIVPHLEVRAEVTD